MRICNVIVLLEPPTQIRDVRTLSQTGRWSDCSRPSHHFGSKKLQFWLTACPGDVRAGLKKQKTPMSFFVPTNHSYSMMSNSGIGGNLIIMPSNFTTNTPEYAISGQSVILEFLHFDMCKGLFSIWAQYITCSCRRNFLLYRWGLGVKLIYGAKDSLSEWTPACKVYQTTKKGQEEVVDGRDIGVKNTI